MPGPEQRPVSVLEVRDRGRWTALLVACALVACFSLAWASTPAPEPGGEPTATPVLRDVSMIAARTAALLLSGQSGGDIDAVLGWSLDAQAIDGRPATVRWVVEIRGSSLLAGHQAERLVVGVYGYVLDGDRRIRSHIARAVDLPLAVHGDRLEQTGLRLQGTVQVHPGATTLRLLVRNHQTDHFSLLMAGIEVPGTGDDHPAILPPRLPLPPDAWVDVRSGQETLSGPAAGADAPAGDTRLTTAAPGRTGDGWSALPVLHTGHATRLLVQGVLWPASAQLEALVVDPHGRVAATPLLGVERLPADGGLAGPLTTYSVSMAPFDAPSGRYRLVLQLEGAGNETARRTTPVVVLSGRDLPEPEGAAGPAIHEGDGPKGPAWASLDLDNLANLANLAGPPRAPEEASRHAKLSSKQIRDAYRKALVTLATGDEEAALEMVASLEREAFSQDLIHGLSVVGHMERNAVERLGRERPKSLPPVVMLHHELCRRYQVRSESPLATHSWKLTADLAELAARRDETPEGHAFAVEALVSLASFLIDRSSSRQAASLLDRALALDPDNDQALLGLGLILERSGRYQEAVAQLERLVASRPSNAEGRLRLAVNQARLGRHARATRMLRKLTRGSHPEWIRALAYQELARIELGQDRIAQTCRLLEEAVHAVPSNQRLRILLAYALDQGRRPWESAQIIEGLEVQPEDGLGTPRLRYASWQPPDATRSRRSLERTARARLGVLAAELGQTGIEVPSRASLALNKVRSGLGGSLAMSLHPVVAPPAAGFVGRLGDLLRPLPGPGLSTPAPIAPAPRTPQVRRRAGP